MLYTFVSDISCFAETVDVMMTIKHDRLSFDVVLTDNTKTLQLVIGNTCHKFEVCESGGKIQTVGERVVNFNQNVLHVSESFFDWPRNCVSLKTDKQALFYKIEDLDFSVKTAILFMGCHVTSELLSRVINSDDVGFSHCTFDEVVSTPPNIRTLRFDKCKSSSRVVFDSINRLLVTSESCDKISFSGNVQNYYQIVNSVGVSSIPVMDYQSVADFVLHDIINDDTILPNLPFSHARNVSIKCKRFGAPDPQLSNFTFTVDETAQNGLMRNQHNYTAIEQRDFYAGIRTIEQIDIQRRGRGTSRAIHDQAQSVHHVDLETCFLKYKKQFITEARDVVFNARAWIVANGGNSVVLNECDRINGESYFQVPFRAVCFRASRLDKSHIEDFMKSLEQEITDGRGMCALGRTNRYINSLNGYDPEIVIELSKKESLQNICSVIQNKFQTMHGMKLTDEQEEKLKKAIHDSILEHGFTQEDADMWSQV